MAKVSILFVLLFALFLLPVSADSVQYIYRNLYSTLDIEEPVRGTVYTDAQGDILIIRAVHEKASVFDRLYTAKPVQRGTVLEKRLPLKTVALTGGQQDVGVLFSFTSSLYPFRPLFSAGYSIRLKQAFVRAGFSYGIALNRVFFTNITFFDDATVEGYAQAGVLFGSTVMFNSLIGVGYRHCIGKFVWGVDICRSYCLSKSIYTSFRSVCLTAGVTL